MTLDELQRHWDAFGQRDPLWAILTDPARKGGRWDIAEFFATGVVQIGTLMAEARRLGLPRQRRRALDFGCGVGRLTQALAAHADEVLGLDVAPSMISQARAFNRHGARVRYEVQAAPPLDALATRSIDVAVTSRVLQHIAPEYSRRYLEELARVLAPGGFLSFDLPSRPVDHPTLPPGALPAAAYRAGLAAALHPPADDTPALVDAVVTNTSEEAWPAGTALNVGNHWLAADGALLVADDRRAAVPLPLAPGQSAPINLEVSWPPPQDAAALELDVVHEGVSWFGWMGSPTLRLEVTTGSAAGPAPDRAAEQGFEPVMEMHAIPREEVEALLRQAGVRLLQVRAESHCGPRWEAFRYDVTTEAPR